MYRASLDHGCNQRACYERMFFSGSSRNHRLQGKATIERGKRCQPWFGVQRSICKEISESSSIKNTNDGLLRLVYLVCWVFSKVSGYNSSFPRKRESSIPPLNHSGIHGSKNSLPQISPVRILLLDQFQLPVPVPLLHLFFSANG
jgi:hypothetical protein